jgi:transposase-like protein
MKYPVELRSIIYTTNRIESLNAQLRKNIQNRKVFPTENSLMAILFLNIQTSLKSGLLFVIGVS